MHNDTKGSNANPILAFHIVLLLKLQIFMYNPKWEIEEKLHVLVKLRAIKAISFLAVDLLS